MLPYVAIGALRVSYLLVTLLVGDGDLGVNMTSLPEIQPGEVVFFEVTEALKEKKRFNS